MKAIAESR